MCLLIESIKIKDGILFNLALHQKRMNKARRDLCGCNDEITLQNIINIPVHYKTGLVKCRVLYGKEIQQIDFVSYNLPSIHSLQIVYEDNLDYTYKSADRSAIEAAYKKRGHADDILIIKNGFVTDTFFCNVVLRKGENYFTPNTFLLNGVKRQRLLQEKKITESDIRTDHLKEYDSMHLINAMIDMDDQVYVNIKDINGK